MVMVMLAEVLYVGVVLTAVVGELRSCISSGVMLTVAKFTWWDKLAVMMRVW